MEWFMAPLRQRPGVGVRMALDWQFGAGPLQRAAPAAMCSCSAGSMKPATCRRL